MKQKLWYVASLLLCFSTIFTACSSDNDSPLPIDTDIVGTYKGTLDISLGTQVVGNALPKNITITKASENRINLSLKDFSFEGMNLGTITIANCEVNASESTYSFTGSQTLNLQAPIGECQVKANGTVVNGKATVNLNITVSSLPIAVKVIYQGNRLKGNESAEAKITGFTFESAWVTEQPVIDDAQNTITFKVDAAATTEQINALVPTITISDKATITPASGVAQKFADGITYTVVAEDGTTKAYKVSIAGRQSVTFYDFESWEFDTSIYDEKQQIHLPNGWTSCNTAVALIKNMGSLGGIIYEGEYPVRPTTDCIGGQRAAVLESVDTKGGNLFGQKVPKVTAGSMFLGEFNAMAAMTNPMSTTKFGIEYDKKPLMVKGFFKYTAGNAYYNGDGQLITTKKDECSIAAVLYEIENEEDVLDGSNIYTSDKIVASVMFTNGGTTEFTPFELKLNYIKNYDAAKKYKLAIIFSASKDGASYNAAVGSKLTIDNVSIINE